MDKSSYLKKKDYSIRDENGKWLDSNVFRQEAIKFRKNGYYCADPPGTASYKEYWDEQLRRCIEGYEVGGWKVTGHHYGYLNFCEIQIVDDKSDGAEEDEGRAAIKETKPPDFWDGDYDYFWSIEIAKNGVEHKNALLTDEWQKEIVRGLSKEEKRQARIDIVADLKMKVIPHPDYLDGGHHVVIGKSRRKGYSYKNSFLCANVANTVRKSKTIIGAFDKKYLYPEGTMAMASDYMDYFNKWTAWSKGRENVNKVDIKKNSFNETDPETGITIESGYKSIVMALTFQDNPSAARGKDPLYVLFEESGEFPNIIESYKATEPSLKAGKYITGQILTFGTGGNMAKGTAGFAKIFYSPIAYNCMPFLNIWDKGARGTYCGFFHPVYINMEGYYDEQGNSDVEGALAFELAERDRIIKNSTSSLDIQGRVQEYPISPEEAFLLVSINDFPVVELRAQYNKVIREKLHIKLGQPVYLMGEKGEGDKAKVRARPDLDGVLVPIWDYKLKNLEINDMKGAVVIYEYPIAGAPKGLYKIGFDPYRQDISDTGQPSLGAIYVYKGFHRYSANRDCIVAQYVGRPGSPDSVNKIAEMLAELYGAEIMHENEVTHVKGYFNKRKKLHLLAAQPDAIISAAIKVSKVARVYGIHMVDKLKDAGEKYLKEWLLRERDVDENGYKTLNLETIYDPALLEELISYNRKGNFDRVMALMMVMFMVEEEGERKDHSEEDATTSNIKDLLSMMNKQFKKN